MTAVATIPASGGTLVPKSKIEDVKKMSAVARMCERELVECTDPIVRAVVLANAVQQLRECFTPQILHDFRALMNTPLGFRTDQPSQKKPEFYKDNVLTDCLIQALLRGLRPTGNEFNIIAGNLYVTKEGYTRLLREFPGLTCFRSKRGKITESAGGAMVEYSAWWKLHGQDQSLELTGESAIPVKRNEAMGLDAVVGKAESKLLRRVYAQLVGSDWAPMDDATGEESSSGGA